MVIAAATSVLLSLFLQSPPSASQTSAPQTPSTAAPAEAAKIPQIRLQRLWTKAKLTRPVQVVARPDSPNLLYAVEQAGRVVELDLSNAEHEGRLVLDLTGPVHDKFNEQGLLSLAFHPRFAETRQVFVWYTARKSGKDPAREVLARLTMAADGTIDPATHEVLLTVEDPEWNHNGGTVLFGPDGMMYVSSGDGGSGNDPWGNGQNTNTLLGCIMRIDVDRTADGKLYAIPSDNPFVGKPAAKPEMYAYGLRNVWRMSFDRKTGELYAGDVGQNAFEEIDIIVKGGNYGWRPREGFHATNGVPDASEASERFIEPIAEYPHNDGVSVTGGFVYRGSEYPSLAGVYLYADYAFGTFWGLRAEGGVLKSQPKVVMTKRGFCPASFGEANDGTLFVCGTSPGADGPGMIFKIVAAD
ncbi:MAG: glucose sorbosone dehydrogenase [Planctomycetes bacterium]|nr:glucose sorbosone dehydrogenase [Planctomycetota bacterium]